MKPLKQIFIHILLTLTVALSQKSSDESRPYEFGFTIDGEQHRHEKKDQNGIIQGEFGFITADGVYHVTVYATDENGNFKILSRRNIRISAPLDGSPATGPISPEAGKYLGKQKQLGGAAPPSSPAQPQRPSQPQPPPQQYPQPSSPSSQPPQQYPQSSSASSQPPVGPQVPQSTTQKSRLYEFTTQSTIKPACGGCGYVTTAKPFEFQNPAFQKQSNGVGGALPPSNGGSSGVVQSPLGGQYQQQPGSSQQNVPNQLQGNLQNTQPGSNFGQSPAPSPANAQYPYDQNQQQNVEPPSGTFNQQNTQTGNNFGQSPASSPANAQYPYGQDQQQNVEPPSGTFNQQQPFGQSGGNLGQSPGANLLPSGFNRGNAGQQASIGQGPANPLYQNGNIPNEQEFGLFGSLNKGANGHIQSPSTSGSEFVPSIPSPPGQREEISALPPVSVSGNTIHVAGKKPLDIPIRDKYPGMVDGLPDGVQEKDIKDILYKFHYTVGFHGHYEKGLKNGAKIGGYFVNGRDGISRVVTYIADENGYRPKFKFINLGLDSDDTPKEGSEKTFGLKSFEFVWYPVE